MSSITADPKTTRRLHELQAVRDVLWPDRDDPRVMSELTQIQTALNALTTTDKVTT